MTWVAAKMDPPHETVHGVKVELRTEVLVLLSADCDLVDRTPPKRKSILASPLRSVPKNIANNPERLAALKAPTIQPEGIGTVPANQFYFAEVTSPTGDRVSEGVIFLETITSLGFSDLKAATKLAELTKEKRLDLQERIKWHFTRTETN